MTASSRNYGGVSAEQRRGQRRAALLDAALELISEAGPDAATKKAVCARARLNDRYFYEHFTDRDALLETLAQEHTAAGLQVVVAAVLEANPSDLAEVVHAAVESGLAFFDADPRRRSLLLASREIEVVGRARRATQHTIATAMSALATELLGEDARAPLDLTMTAYTLISGTLELVAAWFRDEFKASREQLVEVVAATMLASLNVSDRTGAPAC